MCSEISKQEFLKRYMESKDCDRKRKNKLKPKNKTISRLKIVDQDIDLKSIKFDDNANEDEDDEAPLVAEVIDDRPMEIKIKELYESTRWKKIDNNEDSQIASVIDSKSASTEYNSKIPKSVQSEHLPSLSLKSDDLNFSKHARKDFNDDYSSPRNANKVLNKTRHDSDSDVSPVRKQKHINNKRHESGSDISPPRSQKGINNKRHDSDSDISPPRSQKDINNKRCNNDSDVSLPHNKNQRFSRKRHDSGSDLSPPRSRQKHMNKKYDSHSDISPPRNVNQKKIISDSDISPPRTDGLVRNRNQGNSDSDKISRDKSSKRNHHRSSHDKYLESKHSVLRTTKNQIVLYGRKRNDQNNKSDSDISPPRYKSSKDKSFDKSGKPTKTLSGLKAGLQNSITLKEETEEQKRREKNHINMLDDEISGRNAETIIRDKRTGMKRDLSQENEMKKEEGKKTEEQKQKYSEWGKGIEQTQNMKDKFEEDLYEMSKPLARYRDDEDLDEKLKAIIHEDDPMAEFIKKKRKKDTPSLPVYNGPAAPPNRFGIPPGYRWDGVDRSNGFEKRCFEKINNSEAVQEEAYLWSVQNM